MIRAVRRISSRTGRGRFPPPPLRASPPCRSSSSFICATMRARALVVGRQLVQVRLEVLDHLLFGLDRRTRGSSGRRQMPAMAPMANEPAYQSGASRLVRLSRSRTRCSHQARWSVSSRAACEQLRTEGRVARGQGLAVIERLGGNFAGVVDAHQAAACLAGGRVVDGLVRPWSGKGRAATLAAATVRRPRSNSWIRRSARLRRRAGAGALRGMALIIWGGSACVGGPAGPGRRSAESVRPPFGLLCIGRTARIEFAALCTIDRPWSLSR